jgi:hypothetical protein
VRFLDGKAALCPVTAPRALQISQPLLQKIFSSRSKFSVGVWRKFPRFLDGNSRTTTHEDRLRFDPPRT